MTLVFITDARFEKTFEGKIYSITGSFNLKLWNRYLEKFDNIVVIARVTNTEKIPSIELLANSERVSFVALPYYIGFGAFLKKRKIIKKMLKSQAITGRSYLCRVPSMLGGLMTNILKNNNIKYGVEVVGDPWDVFSSKIIKNCLVPLMRIYSYFSLRKVVRNASVALYVTKEQLQKRYPTAKGVFSTYASNVVMPDNLILKNIKKFSKTTKNHIKILSVGHLDQMYKAPDVAIDAIGLLTERGLDCTLKWIGDGLYKEDMIRYVVKKGLSDRVNFVGRVLPTKVREYMLDCDIFMLISRTEGLPRAIIEAMGAGLPCIGTRIGGIPELLENGVLVKQNDAVAVADKIETFIKDNDFANYHAQRNLTESEQYKESLLKARREEFYDKLIQLEK